MTDLKDRLLAKSTFGTRGAVPGGYVNPDGPEAQARIEALEARIAELEGALLKFGGHKPPCKLVIAMGGKCDCGWHEARASLDKGKTND